MFSPTHGALDGLRRGVMRALHDRDYPGPVPASVIIGLVFLGCWAAAVATGPVSVYRHLFYVPIVLAAARFGMPGAIVGSATAALLGGPLASLAAGDPPAELGVWGVRAVFYLAIGLLVAGLTRRIEVLGRRELRVAHHERELAAQRVALVEVVSHEFRSPLTVMSGVADALRRHELVDLAGKPLLDSLDRAVATFGDLTEVMLAASEAIGAEAGLGDRETVVDLGELVSLVTHQMSQSDATNRVRFSAGDGARRIVTVPLALRLTLRILLSNALKFAPERSPVDVWCHRVEDEVEITVRDQGDPDRADATGLEFEPDLDLPSALDERLNVGLLAARKMVARLGGDFEVRRHTLGGTVAVIRLPQRRAADVEVRVRGDDERPWS